MLGGGRRAISPELGLLLRYLSAIAELAPAPRLPVRPGAIDWARWLALADEHQLGPLLGARLDLWPSDAPSPPEAVARTLRRRYARAGLSAALRDAELRVVLDALGPDLAPIVLKGAALAGDLYAESAERVMSDLDLLVPSAEALLASRARLEALGYAEKNGPATEAPKAGHHHAPPLVSARREQTIELHTNLATPGPPGEAVRGLFVRRRWCEAARCFVLDPASQALHHALHALADPIDSPLLRNLFEVAWLTARLDPGGRSALASAAKAWGVEVRVAPAFALAARLFGVPPLATVGDRAGQIAWTTAWCLARLEWTGAFGAQPLGARLRRSVAREHLGALARGEGALGLAPILARALRRGARTRFEGLRERLRVGFAPSTPGSSLVAPAGLPSALVGGCLLVHDVRSGAVHLLDAVSSEVWAAADRTHDVDRLAADLAAHGLEPSAIHAALVRLEAAGLLVSRAPRGAPPPFAGAARSEAEPSETGGRTHSGR